jgi:hypothetical protein
LGEVTFKGRKASQVENDFLRVTVLHQGGHIAEVFDKRAGVSPLWIPHWKSIEPSDFGPAQYEQFGPGPDAKLLVGIMGHNICLDLFGGPSEQEASAGLTVHGEASVNVYEIDQSEAELISQVTLPLAQLRFTRTLRLHGHQVQICERVENLSALDRPLAWTQHVTLSPPFLDPASTEFRASLGRSIVSETDPGFAQYLQPGAKFDWPLAPAKDGSQGNLQRMRQSAPASGYTAHTVSKRNENAYFVAYSAKFKLAFGYIWRTADFPWLGIWEENCSRTATPWDRITVTRGMEFGVSPFPESRRETIERSRLLDTPTYRWLGAHEKLEVEYWITSQIETVVPESISWPAL